MSQITFPENLGGLFQREQFLRSKALEIIHSDPDLLLHLNMVETGMNLADLIRQKSNDDEDFKVIVMLSIRIFNAFGAILNLLQTGYHQNAALIMRDTLETIFLLDWFQTDRSVIKRWRFAETKKEREEFSPVAVRIFLDKRDGNNTKNREKNYKMFCELAAHPNMHSQHMMRPLPGTDIVIGPFMESTALVAGLAELGKLALQAGELINKFLPSSEYLDDNQIHFVLIKTRWIQTFFPSLQEKNRER